LPAENLTDLDPGTTFTHLDATTILSRGLVAKGIHPTVDPFRFNFNYSPTFR